jgi:hypothetical protein
LYFESRSYLLKRRYALNALMGAEVDPARIGVRRWSGTGYIFATDKNRR